jgi:tetratricopeptide (TPR) repeat protein
MTPRGPLRVKAQLQDPVRPTTALTIISLSLLIAGAVPPAFSATASPDIVKLDKFLDDGKFEDARQLIKTLLEKYPQRADLHMWYARRLRSTGQTEQAIAEFVKAGVLQPDCAEASIALSDIYLQNLDVEHSIKYAYKAVEAEPTSSAARKALLAALIQGDLLSEAEKQLQLMLKTASANPDIYLLAFQLKNKKGDIKQARSYLEQAVNACPQQLQWQLQLAALLENSGEAAAARARWETILRTDPGLTEARLRLARNLEVFSQNYDGAIAQYRLVLRSDPNSPSALAGLDRCLDKKNNLALQLKTAIQQMCKAFTRK